MYALTEADRQVEGAVHWGWYEWVLNGFPLNDNGQSNTEPRFSDKRQVTYGTNTFTVFNDDVFGTNNLTYFLVRDGTVYAIDDWRVGTFSESIVQAMLASLQITSGNIGWKTYTNTTYGYSFQYPAGWTPGDSPNSSIPNPITSDIAFDGSGYDGFRFAVRVTKPTNCSSLQTCAEQNRATFGTGEESSGLTATTVAGANALTEIITRPTAGNWKYYVNYVYRNNYLYTTHTIAKATDDTETKPTFEEILATFQFTD